MSKRSRGYLSAEFLQWIQDRFWDVMGHTPLWMFVAVVLLAFGLFELFRGG